MTSLGELAGLVEGRLHGDASLEISGATPLADVGPGQITLVDGPAKLEAFERSSAAAAVVPLEPALTTNRPTIAVADVHAAFSVIVRHFRPPAVDTLEGIHPAAHVSPTAQLAPDVVVHAGATIGEHARIGSGTRIGSGVSIGANCVVGEDVTLFPHTVLYEGTRVGDRCIIHAGAVLGSYGFGYEQKAGRHEPSAQLGWVELGADVEIGASTTIDRGTYGATSIGQGTKIDNLVQIAHNCRIGRHNLICSQVGIAGSTTTGDYVVMAGQAGIRDHVHIGDGAVLSAMAGITANVPAGTVMMGIPATPEREQKLRQAAFAKLVEMRKEFKAVKRTLKELGQKIDGPEATPPVSEGDLPGNSPQGAAA